MATIKVCFSLFTIFTSVASFLVWGGGGGGGQDPQMYRQKENVTNYIFSGLQIHLHIQSMQFPFITYGIALYLDRIMTKY